MKKLVLCFDGSWNKLDAPYQTNVVITAESVSSHAPDGTCQLIFYDEGLGTTKGQTLRGGMFGKGIVQNLSDGYRFMIFNYKPNDRFSSLASRAALTRRVHSLAS